jgi:hypothetical protein
MRLATAAVIAALGLSGVSACASNRGPAGVDWTAGSSAPTVTVQNDNWLDVVVYILRGPSRFRIGTVRATSTETFRLKSDGTAGLLPVRLMADPIGSNLGYVTDPIVIGPGQRLELRVAGAINTSTYSIRNP